METDRALAERLKRRTACRASFCLHDNSSSGENQMKLLSAGLAAVFAMMLLTAPEARAWGCKGHQTVALIAEKHLTPEAKQMVETLLKNNPIDPKLKRYCGDAVRDAMADTSTWPDDVRGEKKNGPWH
jgi:hypothetical protein